LWKKHQRISGKYERTVTYDEAKRLDMENKPHFRPVASEMIGFYYIVVRDEARLQLTTK